MYRSAIAGVVLIGVLAPGFTAAQDPDVETPGLAESLTELNETLGEIRRLLAQQLETQNLALLMTRVEFSASQLAQLEGQLRSAEARRRSLGDEKERIGARARTMTAQIESGSWELPQEERDALFAQMDRELERLEESIRDADLEIAELRAQTAEKQTEVRGWQDVLDTRLGGS